MRMALGGGGASKLDHLIIAASDTPAAMKGLAGFVCSGSEDQAEINPLLIGYSGGVEFLPGTYHVSYPVKLPSNVDVYGHGNETTFRIMDHATDLPIINAAKSSGGALTAGTYQVMVSGIHENGEWFSDAKQLSILAGEKITVTPTTVYPIYKILRVYVSVNWGSFYRVMDNLQVTTAAIEITTPPTGAEPVGDSGGQTTRQTFGVFANTDTVGGNSGITIHDLAIDGNAPNQGNLGVDTMGDFATVADLTMENIYGSAVRGIKIVGCSNVRLIGFTGVFSDGVNSLGSSGITVERFAVTTYDFVGAADGDMFDFYNNDSPAILLEGLTIRDCVVRDTLGAKFIYADGYTNICVENNVSSVADTCIVLNDCTNANIRGNNLGCMALGQPDSIQITNGGNVVVQGNFIQNTNAAVGIGSGIYAYQTSQVVFTGNTVTKCGTGIETHYCHESIITGNHVFANSRYGISVDENNYCLVANNIATGNGLVSGTSHSNIDVEYCLDLKVSGNYCRKGGAAYCMYGIYLASNTKALVTDNDCNTGGVTAGIYDAAATAIYGGGNRINNGTWATTAG